MKLKYIVAVERKNLTEQDEVRLLDMDGTEYGSEQLFKGHLKDSLAETALEELAKKKLTMMLESDKFVRVDKAYKALCDVCFETTIKLLRFNALAELCDAVKDWSQDSGLIDTDLS